MKIGIVGARKTALHRVVAFFCADEAQPASWRRPEASTDSAAADEVLVRSFYERVTRGDEAGLRALLAAAWQELPPVYPGQPDGAEGYLPIVRGFNAAFPDGRFEIHEVLPSGNRYTVRTTFHGTHRGDFAGRPASGASIRFDTIDIHEVVGGCITRSHHIEDFAAFHAQVDAAAKAAAAA